jgi:hypothetical protein
VTIGTLFLLTFIVAALVDVGLPLPWASSPRAWTESCECCLL